MSNNFGMFLLFSVLVIGINSLAFAEETTVNATETIGMTELSNSTSTGDETMAIEDEILITVDEMPETIPSPLKQIKEGVVPENVICKEGLELVFKLNGQPACVKTTSVEKLITWGWAK